MLHLSTINWSHSTKAPYRNYGTLMSFREVDFKDSKDILNKLKNPPEKIRNFFQMRTNKLEHCQIFITSGLQKTVQWYKQLRWTTLMPCVMVVKCTAMLTCLCLWGNIFAAVLVCNLSLQLRTVIRPWHVHVVAWCVILIFWRLVWGQLTDAIGW